MLCMTLSYFFGMFDQVYKRQLALQWVSVVYSPSAKQRKCDARKQYSNNQYEGD